MPIILALYAVATAVVIGFAYHLVFPAAATTGTWDEFAKVAGVGLTATTSLCTAAISSGAESPLFPACMENYYGDETQGAGL